MRFFFTAALLLASTMTMAEPIDIGSRLEPLVDDHLIATMDNVELLLHHPTARDVAIVYDAPWEGNISCYVTVFQDDDRYRMYYRGANYNLETRESEGERVCYAESIDGITWSKPELGIVTWEGSTANNIIWDGPGSHNFAPFKDTNPHCPPESQYKAIARHEGGLIAFESADGIHWSLLQEAPVITKGAFDSQNLAFYDTVRGRYVDFHRGFNNGFRDIMTSTSDDFINWTEPHYVDYGDAPPEHLYTNAITAYSRAPHIFMGFPKRFVPDRDPGLHEKPGVSDGVFMTSRDGENWHRWQEALLRPGLQDSRWVNRNNMIAWGVLETPSHLEGAPNELSIYSTEGYYVGPCKLRRHTIRMDGVVSIHAGAKEGTFTTRPIVFADDPAVSSDTAATQLVLNYVTSAAGSIRCEIQDAEGTPISGYTLDECDVIYGDDLARPVTWGGKSALEQFASGPVRLRFTLKDADLYALRFN